LETNEETAVDAPARARKAGPAVLALVVAIALLLAGFVAGRSTAAAPTPTPAATPTPTATPAASALGGPARIEKGVPLGYVRTRQGAVAAAVNYAGVITSQRLVDPKTYTDAIAAITAPESRDAELKKANAYLDALEGQYHLIAKAQLGVSVAIRYAPVTHQVVRYDDEQADVRVWGSTVLGIEQELWPVELWSTTTFRLKWVDGDWRVLEQKQDEVTTVPKLLQQNPTRTDAGLSPELGGFEQRLLYGISPQ
jgi:hypothetical protein